MKEPWSKTFKSTANWRFFFDQFISIGMFSCSKIATLESKVKSFSYLECFVLLLQQYSPSTTLAFGFALVGYIHLKKEQRC